MIQAIDKLIDTLTGIDSKDLVTIDREIAASEKRVAMLYKLRAMVPNAPPIVPSIAGLLESTHRKAGRKPESTKPKKSGGETEFLEGNLWTPEERRLAMAKLIADRGPMTPGAIAESLKMDVAKVYNVTAIEPGRSLFCKGPDGTQLTDKGRQLLKEGSAD